ncbi:MAG: putative transcriptional regulator [Hyphomicrobiaceae bacterium]|jgi:putative transcriptional regulator
MISFDTQPLDIRGLRRGACMTQEEFAHALGTTVSTVNRWENGHTKPSKLARNSIAMLCSRLTPAESAQAQA